MTDLPLLRRHVLPTLAATMWIGLSEFTRNQVLFLDHWTRHFDGLGIPFSTDAVHGAAWGVWSMGYAATISVVSTRFPAAQTAVLAWVFGFVLMWLVIGTLGVLPWSLLPFALPLSVLEAVVATALVVRVRGGPRVPG